MPTYFLRVEAVNLAHVIFDTHDLSTIRGGGLAVLNGPRRDVLKWLKQRAELSDKLSDVKLVTSGPSLALFGFTATDQPTVDQLVLDLQHHLRTESMLRHATFVVAARAVEETRKGSGGGSASNSFPVESDRLLAINRWQQMQQCRLAPPDITREDGAAATTACDVDFVRPAVVAARSRSAQKNDVSRSVADRREYGRRQKYRFYRETVPDWQPPLSDGCELQPAHDFHQIAARNSALCDSNRTQNLDPFGSLHDKLALIYVDGNRFGKL